MPKSATPPQNAARRGRPQLELEMDEPTVPSALADAQEAAEFDAYVAALLAAPVTALTPAQCRHRAEIEALTVATGPQGQAMIDMLRAAEGPVLVPRPSPGVLVMLAAWQREMAEEISLVARQAPRRAG